MFSQIQVSRYIIPMVCTLVVLLSGGIAYAAIHSSSQIWGINEGGTTSVLLRVCGTGPKEQFRSEGVNPYWKSEVWNRDWPVNNSCTPAPPNGWRVVTGGQPGEKIRIYSLVVDDYLPEAEFMRLARRDLCTINSLANVSCVQEDPTRHPLAVYNETPFSGSWCYSVNPGPANVHTSCTDKISSLTLQSGWSVRLYRDQNQSGPSRCFTANDPDLSNNTYDDGSPINDTVSSFILYQQSSCSNPTSSISGQVRDTKGNRIAQVNISVIGTNGVNRSTTTDSNGNYTVSDLSASSYKITPSKNGYIFSPANYTAVTVPPNATGKNFTGIKHFFITGRVTSSSNQPISGVPLEAITFRGWPPSKLTFNATTGSDGTYFVDGLNSGVYLLRTSSSIYKLSPVVRVIRVSSANVFNQDFTTTPVYGSLGGLVTKAGSGQALANAQVSVGGKVTRTDSTGRYVINNLLPGTQTIRVSADGYKDYKNEVMIQANASTMHNVILEPVRVEGYRLPFPASKTYVCTQGNGGAWSHQWGTALEYAYDWGLKAGDEVVAVREGKVISLRENSVRGGCSPAYATEANTVGVQHSDESVSHYVHLQANSVPVNVGDTVRSGQVIGKVGLSGYVCGAHLHFHRTPSSSSGWTTETSFLDVQGNRGIPQQGSSYTSGNYLASAALVDELAEVGPQADTTLPRGEVQFRLTGQSVQTLQLYAFDYDSGVTEMRLAATEADLQAASWRPYSQEVEWVPLEAWVQFKDAAGNISQPASDTLEAVAFEPIQAAFTISPTVCVGSVPKISNQTTPFCEQCGWDWKLGDGNRSYEVYPALPYPYVGYTTPGVYTITMTVANANSISSVSKPVEALPIPSPEFTISRSGNTVTVEATTTDAESWLWNFGDGTTATGRMVTHTYTSTESLPLTPVQLTVQASNGCSSSAHEYVPEESRHSTYLPIIIK